MARTRHNGTGPGIILLGLLAVLPPRAHAEQGAAPAQTTEEARQNASGEGAEVPTQEAPDDGGDARLSARVDELMDRMVRARTRLSALGEALYKTRVRIEVENQVEGFRIRNVRLFLDDAPVYQGDGTGLTEDARVRLYSGYAAPGLHRVRPEIERSSAEDGRYGYTLEQHFAFRVVQDKLTEVRVRLDGDSDIAEDFEDDEDGSYDVRTRVRVRTRPLEER